MDQQLEAKRKWEVKRLLGAVISLADAYDALEMLQSPKQSVKFSIAVGKVLESDPWVQSVLKAGPTMTNQAVIEQAVEVFRADVMAGLYSWLPDTLSTPVTASFDHGAPFKGGPSNQLCDHCPHVGVTLVCNQTCTGWSDDE